MQFASSMQMPCSTVVSFTEAIWTYFTLFYVKVNIGSSVGTLSWCSAGLHPVASVTKRRCSRAGTCTGSSQLSSSIGDVTDYSGDGTADCVQLGLAPLDVDLCILPKELDEKVAELLFQVVGTELFRIFQIFFWIF